MDDYGKNLADDTHEMASEAMINPTAELRKRRSTRIVQAVPLVVTAVCRTDFQPDYQLSRLPIPV
jgi:hypothetical protein